ncbi:MAG: hypothetical protein ACYSUI_21635 [Planctomycetota bacterium]
MRRFLSRFQDKITGVIDGFDRIVFRGWLGQFCFEGGMEGFLASQGVLLKDFEPFAKHLTDILRADAEAVAEKLGQDKVYYLSSAKESKEDLGRKYMAERNVRFGPICVLSALEPCTTWEVRRHADRSQPQTFRRRSAKCLHHYHYFFDRRFGFGHVRVQTWFPFQVRVCLNGREWLGRRLDDRRMRYERADNCFPWIASPERAQEMMDEFVTLAWPKILDDLVITANPMLGTLIHELGQSFYWTTWQAEWATDVMFKDAESLAECYPYFLRYGIENLKSVDVMRFLGKKLHGNHNGEITTDYKKRIEGARIKHWAYMNSLKLYDKYGLVLRPEATINDPGQFKVRRKAQGNPDSAVELRPIRKTVVDLGRLARTAKACTHRYLDAFANVAVDTPLHKIVEPLTRPTELAGRRVRGLRPWTSPDVELLEAVGRGEFIINGFRNRDLVPLLYPKVPDDPAERRKVSAKVTRLLRLLRAHGIIEKVKGTHRYLVTTRGRTAIDAVIAARNAPLSELQQAA